MAFCSGVKAEMSWAARRRLASRACRARSVARSAGRVMGAMRVIAPARKSKSPSPCSLAKVRGLACQKLLFIDGQPVAAHHRRRLVVRLLDHQEEVAVVGHQHAAVVFPIAGHLAAVGRLRRVLLHRLDFDRARKFPLRTSNRPKSGRPAPVSASSAVACTAGSSRLPTALSRFSSAAR